MAKLVVACFSVLCLLACEDSDTSASDGGGARADASSAGTGGRAGDGGSAGSGGDAGGQDAAISDAGDDLEDGGEAPCQPCIGKTIGWGPNGGFVAYTERSELASCNVYTRTRSPAGDPGQVSLSCERPLPCMGSGLHGIADVLRALEHPDVVAARAKGDVLYGVDARPVDGQVLRIELPGSVIEVGRGTRR